MVGQHTHTRALPFLPLDIIIIFSYILIVFNQFLIALYKLSTPHAPPSRIYTVNRDSALKPWRVYADFKLIIASLTSHFLRTISCACVCVWFWSRVQNHLTSYYILGSTRLIIFFILFFLRLLLDKVAICAFLLWLENVRSISFVRVINEILWLLGSSKKKYCFDFFNSDITHLWYTFVVDCICCNEFCGIAKITDSRNSACAINKKSIYIFSIYRLLSDLLLRCDNYYYDVNRIILRLKVLYFWEYLYIIRFSSWYVRRRFRVDSRDKKLFISHQFPFSFSWQEKKSSIGPLEIKLFNQLLSLSTHWEQNLSINIIIIYQCEASVSNLLYRLHISDYNDFFFLFNIIVLYFIRASINFSLQYLMHLAHVLRQLGIYIL